MEFGDDKTLYLRDTWKEANMICGVLPTNPNSNGIWPSPKFSDSKANIAFSDYMFPHVQIIFLVVTILWQFFHFFLKRLGMIRFTSHMLTGILLSKSLVKDNTPLRHFFSTEDYKESVFGLLSACSYMMFWFLMGVKMDLSLIRNTGKKAISIGLSSVLLSMAVCSLLFFGNITNFATKNGNNPLEIVFIYSIQCLSSFPVVGNLLFELRLQNSELGRLAMSSAVISDFITSILSTVLIFLKELNDEKIRLGSIFIGDVIVGNRPLKHAGTIVLFVCFAVYIFRPLMFYIVKRTPSGRPVKKFYVYFIIILVFGSAILANWSKQSIFMGPFILGLAVPHGPPLGSAIIQKFEPAIFGTFLPFFVATSATELDTATLLHWTDLKSVVLIILISVFVKFVLTILPALFLRMPANDCFALSLIMSFKGIFEFGAYAFGFQRGSIRPATFTVLSLYILLNSAIIPPILRYIYDPSRKYAGYEKRNMLHMKPNSELRILSCIYKTDDIRPMINLLEASCPSRENPVATYVLHLMELVGQASPVFISHRLQTRKTEEKSYSENVLVCFEQFHKDFFGSVFISIYTALSVPKTMQEDICMLALNNNTSLIIIPFHQTWSADGSAILLDSNTTRKLNKSVLEMSPCSVGIFVYRSSNGRRTIRETSANFSSYKVCMLFLGGKDDREALSFAKRMAGESKIDIKVVSLVSSDEKAKELPDWERMLDLEQLRGVKNSGLTGGIDMCYKEEVVDDVLQTSRLLKSMANEFDLFIVGRGKGRKSVFTEGLEEWSEFDELGVIGDLLTSKDLKCHASVLVIQQQQQMI